MNIQQVAEWVAPAATMIAAIMTASNLGTRVTGWGFVIFTIGSISWSAIGISTGQQGLLMTNAFLTIVNLVGVYRWLGRQARFEQGSKSAAAQSEQAGSACLFSANGATGAKVLSSDREQVGTIVDLMLQTGANDISYAVITDGGLAGLEEKLRAVPAAQLDFGNDTVSFGGSAGQFRNIATIEHEAWPAAERVQGERVHAC